jgi:oligopeptide/dipeptide ABC transporter ATP-binding protein
LFEGRDLLKMGDKELRQLRGPKMAAIFQDPLSSLHPLYKVGWQIVEMIRAHEPISKAKAKLRAVELLKMVGIPQPDLRVDDYPHQFSGGMRQRAMIAMALSLNPTLIIADEPTTALDATVQAQILTLLGRLQKELDSALIMITHDLGVIADIADNVMVMYAGRAVENADRRSLYYQPHHPYTRGLLESVPGSTGAGERLRAIPGQPPSLINLPTGCGFHPRCRYVMDECVTNLPELLPVGGSDVHTSACWLPANLVGLDEKTEQGRLDAAAAGRGEKVNQVAATLAEQPVGAHAAGTASSSETSGSGPRHAQERD